MNKKYHYLYQVTHKESGRIYIGIHSTDNLNDRYFACGVHEASEKSDAEWAKINHEFENPNHIVNALQKYGRKAFEREILEFRDTREEILKLEAVYVDEEFVVSSLTFNQRSGGEGSFFSDETRALISKNNSMHRSEVRQKVSKAGKERWTDEMKSELSENNPMYRQENIEKLAGKNSVWYGRSHSEETKKKISDKRKEQEKVGRTEQQRLRTQASMIETSKDLTEIEDLETGKTLTSLNQVQKILLDEYGLKRAISTISLHLTGKMKVKSIITKRFQYKRRRVAAPPKLRLKKRGKSYGFHVWLPWAKNTISGHCLQQMRPKQD